MSGEMKVMRLLSSTLQLREERFSPIDFGDGFFEHRSD
jgi:hypothetical protein